MLIVLSISAAAALIVVASSRLRQYSPEAGTAGLRAVRDLADVVIICVRAVESVVDVLARPARLSTTTATQQWDEGYEHESQYDPEDREL
jgi:hypothetical protein